MKKCPAHTPEQKSLFNLCKKYGMDLIQIDIHSNACEICQNYQGKIYSISGRDKTFPKLQEQPPYHKDCRHILCPVTRESLEHRGYLNEIIKLSNSSIKVKDFQHFESLMKRMI